MLKLTFHEILNSQDAEQEITIVGCPLREENITKAEAREYETDFGNGSSCPAN